MKKMIKASLVFMLFAFLCCNCKHNKCTNSSECNSSECNKFMHNVYANNITNINISNSICLLWNDLEEPLGCITIKEDDRNNNLIRTKLYIFLQKKDTLILSTEYKDNIDTCYIRHISEDSIVLQHNNEDLFNTNKNITILYNERL